MIPIANTNHFMIVDELSAALASRPGYGSGGGWRARHSRSSPAGLYGTHLSAIPIAVMSRGVHRASVPEHEGDPEQDYFADGVAEDIVARCHQLS